MNFSTLKGLTIPEGVVTKIEAGGKVLWQLATVPDTPTATQYLYGRPSETGNIGLRSGDTVTLYNGTVLPDINTVYTDELKQTHPNAVVSQFLDLYRLTFYSAPVYLEYNAFANIYYSEEVCSCIAYTFCELDGDTAWNTNEDGNATDVAVGEQVGRASKPIWSNFELRKTVMGTDETTYLSATDPIPVTGIVGYSYNGTVLPELPEWDKTKYPYAYILQPVSGTAYKLVAKTTKQEASTDGKIAIGDLVFAVVDGAWVEADSQGIRKVIWTNSDLYHKDGTLYLDASDPIPVYE